MQRHGQLLGTYRLMRLLGTGGFAEVYLGKQLYAGLPVAIKVLRGPFNSKEQQLFLSMGSQLCYLEHPNILRPRDVGMQDSMTFLVMDYIASGNLRTRHMGNRPLPSSTCLSYVLQTAAALSYLHERQILHRDLKPENLFLGAEGLLLSDFGLAQIVQKSTAINVLPLHGTLAYTAPEIFEGKASAASDQYALGIMAYEWLTGSPPFQGLMAEVCYQHLYAPVPNPVELRPAIPPSLARVVLTALAKDPRQRFANVQTFAVAFERAFQGANEQEIRLFLPQSPAPAFASRTGLTARELDVLRLLTEGLQNREIANRLGLSVLTVNAYLRSLYNKLGVTSRTQAMRYALDHDLLS